MREMNDARRQHYGVFYGLEAPPAGSIALVWGNCQAESIRVLLSSVDGLPFTPVRIPPVHEIARADLHHVRALLGRTTLLASQPVRVGFRGLPLGTAELAAALPRGARVVRWPVIRHPALHPWSVIVRHPRDPAAVPPPVPYHDLRPLSEAAGRRRGPPATPAALRQIGDRGLGELARREARDTDVGVADVIGSFGATAAHTLNHPGNGPLRILAERVLAAAGTDTPVGDPGRELLGGVRAPLRRDVLDALGLPDPPRRHWQADGHEISEDRVRIEQLRWYATHPDWVAAGVERHAETLELLNL